MLLEEAWKTLGRDLGLILRDLRNIPQASDRVEAAKRLCEEARITAKKLMAVHHPDRGGNSNKFRQAQEAYKIVVEDTEKLERQFKERLIEKENIRSKKDFIHVEKYK